MQASVMMSFSYLLSVLLSILDPDITAAVYTVCGGGILGYIIKSAFEKNSRNKYGLDADGNPFGLTDTYLDKDNELKKTGSVYTTCFACYM